MQKHKLPTYQFSEFESGSVGSVPYIFLVRIRIPNSGSATLIKTDSGTGTYLGVSKYSATFTLERKQ
jgi:hypothetical protein